MGITLDNASNNFTFVNLLSGWATNKLLLFDDDFHFNCFAHVINLGVQDALTCLEKEISKVNLLIYLLFLVNFKIDSILFFIL